MDFIRIPGCLFAAVFISGCTLFHPLYGDYGVSELKVDPNGAAAKLRAAIISPPAQPGQPQVDQACFSVPVKNDSPSTDKIAQCQQQRNDVTATLLTASDDLCQAHLKTIFGNDATFNIITGSITNLAAGWATFTNGLAAKTTLSAIALFSNAERSLVNETVYKNMLVPVVTKKIREARDEKAAAMIPGNFAKSINDYTMTMAIHDVVSYHYTCSFMFGLDKALEEGSQPGLDAKKARLETEKQRLENYVDSRRTSLTLQKFAASQIDGDPGDPGIKGAMARISAIENQLKTLAQVTAGTSASDGAKNVTSGQSAVNLSASRIEFENQDQGKTSDPKLVTYTNASQKDVTVSDISVTGAAATNFAQKNNCTGSKVPSGGACGISITFTPSAEGNRQGVVVITDDASGSPRAISLTGTGNKIIAVKLSPTTIDFGGQDQGKQSQEKSITYTNNTHADITVSNISITGDFVQKNNCTTAQVPSGGPCAINVTFTPTAIGARTGILTITDNVAGSPRTIQLTGTGK